MQFPKLTLKKEMERSWLIQRLHKSFVGGNELQNSFLSSLAFGGGIVNGGFSKAAMGILKKVFEFDYMGSAEFEWGAVPAAISFLANEAAKGALVYGELVLNGTENVYFISPVTYRNEVVKRITELRKDERELRLKEHCGLKRYFESQDEFCKWNVGWIEIDNGFMFFVDKEMYEKTKELFLEIERQQQEFEKKSEQ